MSETDRHDAVESGPIEYVVVSFPDSEFAGNLVAAIAELLEARIMRIVDIAFVSRDAAGDLTTFDLCELDPHIGQALESLGVNESGTVSDEDLADAGNELEPGHLAALIAWENVWARDAAQAIRDAGGAVTTFRPRASEMAHTVGAWSLEGTEVNA
jgi:hypothetical protein